MLAFIQLIQNCKIQVFFTAKQLFFFFDISLKSWLRLIQVVAN